MQPTLFLDTEFTDLMEPELLSLGIASAKGDEHYVELDLEDPLGMAIVKRASAFVEEGNVLPQWGRVPGATATRQQMGERTARWLHSQIASLGQPAYIAFDHPVDFQLLVHLLHDTGYWSGLSSQLLPLNVGEQVSRFCARLAEAAAFSHMSRRGLDRHHALADAVALHAAWRGFCGVKPVVL